MCRILKRSPHCKLQSMQCGPPIELQATLFSIYFVTITCSLHDFFEEFLRIARTNQRSVVAVFVYRTHDGTISIGLLNHTVVIFHNEIFTQLLPCIDSTLSSHVCIVSQELYRLGWILFIHGESCTFNACLSIGISVYSGILLFNSQASVLFW